MKYSVTFSKGQPLRVSITDKDSSRVAVLNREKSVQFLTVYSTLIDLRNSGLRAVFDDKLKDLCAMMMEAV